ncbi:Pepsin A [Hypsizygus marmoreus]|uniref:Pepsin A n=1 Tax=Hypsizygus marmoreus TaxID=39966 RepID=A0A369JE32_HYPMA|nr:Pepsin A [Hypsizygus marmoreus]
MPLWQGKGKGKARAVAQEEGSGGTDGIVLPLEVVGSGVYDIAYTIQIQIGDGKQKLSLQVDTGSSDLWVTSRTCTSSLCGQAGGHTYDPSAAINTGVQFSINYLQGSVSGPVVWDKVEVGGYSIENQALAAADTIANEPISSGFNGILGLALPLNSIIAEHIPPVTNNAPDGAAWASNLFSITPISSAPSARFLSLSLSRPGSDRIPSLLGIGRHPAAIVSDPSAIRYSTLVSERSGTLFWKVGVRAITVYVEGEARPIALGRSNSGSVFPTAVLDSGVPLILTTQAVANGIYGAIGISPASDGQYYVPCATPLNMTITLDDRPEIPIHPLDLTAEPPKDNQAEFCIGLIQPADVVLAVPNSAIGDMILGVPFMRNTYSVMAYEIPEADGTYPTFTPNTTNSTVDPDLESDSQPIRPRLGLMSLTDPVVALEEFKKVRVLNQPISTSPDSSTSPGSTSKEDGGGKKLSVGIIVLIGLLSFFALCFTLFGIRWWFFRRRIRRAGGVATPIGYGNGNGSTLVLERGFFGKRKGGEKDIMMGVYGLAPRSSGDVEGEPSEDVLRSLRYEAYMQSHGLVDLTAGKKNDDGVPVMDVVVEDDGVGVNGHVVPDAEMGYRRSRTGEDAWDPHTALGWGDDTLVAPVPAAHMKKDGDFSPTKDHFPVVLTKDIDPRESSEDDDVQDAGRHARLSPVSAHHRTLSVGVPLLEDVDLGGGRVDEFGVRGEEDEGLGSATSMAGVGTAARGGKIDPDFRSSVVSAGMGGETRPGVSRVRTTTPTNEGPVIFTRPSEDR